MGRFFAIALVLLCACTGAKAETKTEPFGVKFQEVPDKWAIDLQARYLHEDKALVDSIEKQVRQKPEGDWITWANQMVNTSTQVFGSSKEGLCARQAVVKVEVLRRLGFPKERLRLVFGTVSGEEHAVAAVYTSQGRLILDTGKPYKPRLESEVRGFKAERSFY